MKITQDIVDRVLAELAKDELSQRAIARVVGISRGTVHNVACGKIPRVRVSQYDGLPDPSGPPVRCKCGGKVRRPCLLCRLHNVPAHVLSTRLPRMPDAPRPQRPSDAPPGTAAKLDCLAERARRKESLWHPDDRTSSARA